MLNLKSSSNRRRSLRLPFPALPLGITTVSSYLASTARVAVRSVELTLCGGLTFTCCCFDRNFAAVYCRHSTDGRTAVTAITATSGCRFSASTTGPSLPRARRRQGHGGAGPRLAFRRRVGGAGVGVPSVARRLSIVAAALCPDEAGRG